MDNFFETKLRLRLLRIPLKYVLKKASVSLQIMNETTTIVEKKGDISYSGVGLYVDDDFVKNTNFKTGDLVTLKINSLSDVTTQISLSISGNIARTVVPNCTGIKFHGTVPQLGSLLSKGGDTLEEFSNIIKESYERQKANEKEKQNVWNNWQHQKTLVETIVGEVETIQDLMNELLSKLNVVFKEIKGGTESIAFNDLFFAQGIAQTLQRYLDVITKLRSTILNLDKSNNTAKVFCETANLLLSGNDDSQTEAISTYNEENLIELMKKESTLLSKEKIITSMEEQNNSIKGAIFQVTDRLNKLMDALFNLKNIEHGSYRNVVTTVSAIFREKITKDLISMNANQKDIIEILES